MGRNNDLFNLSNNSMLNEIANGNTKISETFKQLQRIMRL